MYKHYYPKYIHLFLPYNPSLLFIGLISFLVFFTERLYPKLTQGSLPRVESVMRSDQRGKTIVGDVLLKYFLSGNMLLTNKSLLARLTMSLRPLFH